MRGERVGECRLGWQLAELGGRVGGWSAELTVSLAQSGLGCKVNMSLSVTQVRSSPFRESDWDRRLDDMLEDLGGTGGPRAVVPSNGAMSQQQFSSSSVQQSYSYSSSSQEQHQVQYCVSSQDN